jgi:RNA polymerase sigma factor (TIGR02999 family)
MARHGVQVPQGLQGIPGPRRKICDGFPASSKNVSGLRLWFMEAAERIAGTPVMTTPHRSVQSNQSAQSRSEGTAIPEADLTRIYGDLRRHAQNLMADERPAHTLEATALVHEALGKLLTELGGQQIELPSESDVSGRRRVLFAMISMRMRHVLIEHARHRNAQKGPGNWTRVPLHEAMEKIEREGVDLPALDRALQELDRSDAAAAIVFQHRWFAGLSMEQIGRVLDISRDDAQERWTRARQLMREIMERADQGAPVEPE